MKKGFWSDGPGSIYTAERMKEFAGSVLRIQAERLRFDPAVCSCYASITIEPAFTGESGNTKGQTDTVTLNDVLPVNITDMDEFAGQALKSEDVYVWSFIVCPDPSFFDGAKEVEHTDWKNDQITFCTPPEKGGELPTEKYDILGYWNENRENCVDLVY